MTFSVKEVFYTLQGEGFHSGRPAIFCRFSGCNLWNGRESDRTDAICSFCDTDFIGTDGQNGGRFNNEEALVKHLVAFWPNNEPHRFIVFTGGEPGLQMTPLLIDLLHQHQFECAIESNGTLPLPNNLDWICISPKGTARVTINTCDELKLVYPQTEIDPSDFDHIQAKHRYLSPQNPPKSNNILSNNSCLNDCINYCLSHPKWKLSLQIHKLINID